MARHFLTLFDLSSQQVERVLEVSGKLKRDRGLFRNALAGNCLGMLFSKSSTRTRVSFEVAAAHLGMHPIFLTTSQIQMGRGEPPEDTARVLSSYVDALVVRTYAQAEIETLAEYGSIPVINALTDLAHPCQALADVQAMIEHLGSARGKRMAYVGAANNVSNSLCAVGPLVGMDVVVVCPPEYGPDEAWMQRCHDAAAAAGTRIEVSADLAAVDGADAVYTDVWASMGQEEEARERMEVLSPYQVDEALMARTADGAIFLHCLPAYRGKEVSAAVIDGPSSRVFDQAANRLHTEKALLLELLGKLDNWG